jgi:hypothetical protein
LGFHWALIAEPSFCILHDFLRFSTLSHLVLEIKMQQGRLLLVMTLLKGVSLLFMDVQTND